MVITEEWLELVQDEQGLANGQIVLLDIWKKRQAFVGFDMLPDQVAHVISTCNGYRGISQELRNWLNNV
jgi:hypothetical protein